ncbi:uncharacterized protein JCM6883_005110 [Sporobolomyces salmoneus]|uniref:uncharacterized protein n=1 Tax=Sporobolomyces salmoneus TaxID=183962 RepID=UPI0031770CA2
MSNPSTNKPTPSAQAPATTGSTTPKLNSPAAPFNYAAAAKKSKPSPAAVTSGDVTGYVNGATSAAGSSPTVPAATAIAQAAGNGSTSSSSSGPTSPSAPAPLSRKQSVRVDGVSVPQSRVDAIRNGAESDVAFGTANDKNAVLSSSPAAPPSLINGAPEAFGALPAQASSPTSAPAAKAPINLHAFFTGGGSSSSNSSSSPAPIPAERRSLATYDPSAVARSPQAGTSPLAVPHPHSQLSNTSASFVPRQIPAPFVPQGQQAPPPQAFSPPSQYYGQSGSYKGPSPQNIPNGNSPYGGHGGAPSGSGSRPGSFVGSPSMQSRPPPPPQGQHRPSFSQQATSPRISTPSLPPQAMYMGQPSYGYNPYAQPYQNYSSGFIPPHGQAGGPPPLSNSPGNSAPSTGLHTPNKSGMTVPPSPSTVPSIAPSTPNTPSFPYSSPQQQSAALPRAFSPQSANNSTPLRSLSLAGAAAPEFKPSVDSPIFTPTPRKSAAIKIVKPDENMLKAKAEKERAAKEAKDKAAAEEAKKREEEKAKAAAQAQAEADLKKKKEEEEEAESKRKAEAAAEEEERSRKEAEEKKIAEEKRVAEEKKKAEEQQEDEKKRQQEEEAEKEKKPAPTDSFKSAAGVENDDSTPSTPGQEVAGLHVKSAEADAVIAEEDALLADEKAVTEPESKDPAQALVDARENLNADSSSKDVNPVSPVPSGSPLPSFLPAKPSTDLSRSSSTEAASSKPATPSSAAIASARPISDLANVEYPDSSKAPSSELNVSSEPGKYRYDRDFLLQFMAICQEKPDNLPNLAEMGMVGDENAPRGNFDRRSQRGGSMGPPSRTASSSGAFGRTASLGGVGGGAFGGMGNFGQAGSGTSSEQRFQASLNRSTSGAFGGARGSMSRTTSQSGMGGAFSGGGGGRNKSERGSKRRGEKDGQKDEGRKPGQHVAGEGFEDATLGPRSATGWAPTVIAGGAGNVDTNSPEMVQRKVKALLNKLTLERFDSISDQILEWANRSVDESDGRILRQVIALIFEKATDEATWSEMYARLCRKLMERVSTEVRDETVKAQDGTPVAGGALFRKYLLNRCQEDYENGWKNKEAATAAAKSKEADDKAKQDANDAAKKEAEEKGTKEEDQKEAELLSDEYYAAQKAKRRGLGLVRFIGELYRLQMLTERIMHECIKKLLSNTENPEEEDVESLCRLLTTVGKGLDNPKAKQHMDIYFSRMNLIANSPKVSSRIRFMILDVVDLRASRWASKQAAAGPKTISEIHADAQKQAEESARRTASSGGKLPRLGDQLSRPNSRRGQGRDFGVAQAGADGWTTQPQRPAKAGDLSGFGRFRENRDSSTLSLGPTGAFANKQKAKKEETRPSTPINPFALLSGGGDEPEAAAPASQRPKLQLKPRTKPLDGEEGDEEEKDQNAGEAEEDEDDGAIDPNASSMSRQEAERRATNSVVEWFEIKNVSEGVASIEALPKEFRPLLVTRIAEAAILKKADAVNITRDLLKETAAKGIVSHEKLLEAFEPVMKTLVDTAVDAPSAYSFTSSLLMGAGASKEEVEKLTEKMESEEGEEEVEYGKESFWKAYEKVATPAA